MASVKVAVRVRPFNQRELGMDAKLIIKMDEKKTRICNNKVAQSKEGGLGREHYKDFTFDYSYWSHEESDPTFASQEKVFQDLGTDVVDSAFQGYNACVFAYGQTGSGKTYTMMGSPECQGLIPRICKTMFSRMAAGKEQGASYRTEVSYLEIYNERVKDLLQPGTGSSHSLRVREHPLHGPYVQDLSFHLVTDYDHIHEVMHRGNMQRTTASTNMNDVSSRSHAIFTITFVQAVFNTDMMPIETVSKVHLVDLAGSERADTSGATGQRLKEGGHINKSLVTLGSVISALAELSAHSFSRRSAFIPYRDSVLTWLLKDSLGGNSKTIMIAAISPADCNYGETLSTLRYANRAKNIINKPTINEDPNVKVIRELREEISKLKALLGDEFTHVLQQKLHEKQEEEKVLTEQWTEKWRETQKILQEQTALGLRKAGTGVVLDSDMPHLVGMVDDDLLSTGVTLYHLKDGETLIGTDNALQPQDIILNGTEVEAHHCRVVLSNGVATLHPQPNALCWVNGTQVDKPIKLSQGCIIVLGTNVFRYNDPIEAAKMRKEGSRSQLNLSHLSLLSWSTPDLALSSENIYSFSEDPEEIKSPITNRSVLESEEESIKNLETAKYLEKPSLLSDSSSESYASFSHDTGETSHSQKEVHPSQETELKTCRSSTIKKTSSLTKLETALVSTEDSLQEIPLENGATKEVLAQRTERQLQELSEKKKSLSLDLRQTITLSKPGSDDSSEQLSPSKLSSTCSSSLGTTDTFHTANSLGTDGKAKPNTEPVQKLTVDKDTSSGTNLNFNKCPDVKVSERLASDESDASSTEDGPKNNHGLSPLSRPNHSPSKRTKSQQNKNIQSLGSLVGEKWDQNISEPLETLKCLCQSVAQQKRLIMHSLESDCDKAEIDAQITVLQDLQRQYMGLEMYLNQQPHYSLHADNVGSSEDSDDVSTYANDGFMEMLRDAKSLQLNDDNNSLTEQFSPASEMSSYTMHSSQDPYQINYVNQSQDFISIPSYVLRGTGGRAHYEYEIRVFCSNGENWCLLRRYKRFRELHINMRLRYGSQVEAIPFPPRVFFTRNSESLAQQRRHDLEIYVRQLLDVCSNIPSCPLYSCRGSLTKLALFEFSSFFRKGVFETGKYSTS